MSDKNENEDSQAQEPEDFPGPPWSRPKQHLAAADAVRRDEAARLLVVRERVAEMCNRLLPAAKRLEAAQRLLREDLMGLLTPDERAYAEAVVANFCRLVPKQRRP